MNSPNDEARVSIGTPAVLTVIRLSRTALLDWFQASAVLRSGEKL